MIVHLIRWLFGFIDFSVNGRFPERFLNLATKNGVNLWNMKGENQVFSASAKKSDINILKLFSKKTQTELHIEKEHGLPYHSKKYSNRIGLFVGLVLFIVICNFLSGYIWSIEVNVPLGINEYEIRSELKEVGFYEGVPLRDVNIRTIKTNMQLIDPRISWITVNISGTRAVIDLNENLSDKIQNDSENKNQNVVSNLVSKADGTVTRIEVQNGSSAVKVGDGIRKGQLLVSGVMVYTNGNNVLADSKANIFAKTSGNVKFEIPDTIDKIKISENTISHKRDINILGVTIPITFVGKPNTECLFSTKNEQLTLLGNTVPIYTKTENFKEISVESKKLDENQAQKILKNRAELYQVFLLYSADKANLLGFKSKCEKTSNGYVCVSSYELEENVCVKSN